MIQKLKTALVAGCVLSMLFALDVLAQGKAQYVGAAKCKMCHKSAAKGNQFGKWEASKHASAFKVLGTDEAKAVAKKAGVTGDPQKAKECLVCHTSNGHNASASVAATFTSAEGVGCESCHGPGSLYKSMKVMKALRAGTQDAAAVDYVKPTKETCLTCHNEKSPTFKPFNFEEERWAKIQHNIPK